MSGAVAGGGGGGGGGEKEVPRGACACKVGSPLLLDTARYVPWDTLLLRRLPHAQVLMLCQGVYMLGLTALIAKYDITQSPARCFQ